MNNSLPADLFNDYQTPTFETGTSVPAQTESAVVSNSSFPWGIVITSAIAAIILFVVIKKMFSKPVYVENITQLPQQQENKVEQETKPHAVEIKNKKGHSNLATPTNINKCIRGFLENTRTK